MSSYVSDGKNAEVDLVIELNKNKNDPKWTTLGVNSTSDHFAIRINRQVLSRTSNEKVNPKADMYVAYGDLSRSIIEKKNFLLTDDDVEEFNLTRKPCTGVSIKRPDSKSYTIHKWTPNSFEKTFGSYNLGAGISIFRTKDEELNNNHKVLKGWKTSWKSFENYFSRINNIELLKDSNVPSEQRKIIAKEITELAKNMLYKRIETEKSIKDHIFFGSLDFDEPYNATWFYLNQELTQEISPFQITTGSGRTKGNYTVVIKPK